MRYSINDYSISPKGKGWGNGWPTDRSDDMRTVSTNDTEANFQVHKRISRLVNMLVDESERRGYKMHPTQCGGYNNRPIIHNGHETKTASNHSWGLAVDINWKLNPQSNDGSVTTNLPRFMEPMWGRFGFAWGGNYHNQFKDPMHFEFMGDKDDADDMTLKAARRFSGDDPPAPEHQPAHLMALPQDIPPAQRDTYLVRSGDTFFTIAKRLHIAGGWSALYLLNKDKIPNPDELYPGQLLKLP